VRVMELKRKLLMFGCAAVFAAAPLVAAAPAAATPCPPGTVASDFAGVCAQGAGGSGAAGVVVPPPVPPPSANVYLNPNGLSSVDGVPCTPQKIGKCIALQESQG
jgi:hypothetical protein